MRHPIIDTASLSVTVIAVSGDGVLLRIVDGGVAREASPLWPAIIEAARSDAPTARLYERIALAALVAESDRLAGMLRRIAERGQVITGDNNGVMCLDGYRIDVGTGWVLDQDARDRMIAKRATGLRMMAAVAARHAVLAEGGGFEVVLGRAVRFEDARAMHPTWETLTGHLIGGAE